jgi:predicted ATP-dependent serine protease
VWEPYLAEGTLNVLAAYMKVGKSTFSYALAVAVARGEKFLGEPTRKGGVLILAVEEHRRDVKLRLAKFGMLPRDPIHVHAAGLDPGAGTLAAIRDYIVAHKIVLLILDTLSRFWRIEDENNNAQVMARLSPLLDLARETGVALLLVHHERKAGGEEGRSIRGGSALFSLVDQALLLERRQGGDRSHRVLRVIGRYEGPAELVLEYADYRYQSLGTVADLGSEERIAQVWAALSDKPQTIDTIAAETDLTPKQIRPVLRALETGDRVIREGAGIRNDPFTYRRAGADSIPSRPHPNREGKKPQGVPAA